MSLPISGYTPALLPHIPAGREVAKESSGDNTKLPDSRVDRAEVRDGANLERSTAGRPPTEADPRLWALLSRSERDFYFRNASFSGLTYGPDASSPLDQAVGRRVGGHVDLTA